MHKYPRTRHIHGSRLQPGDRDLSAAPFSAIAGRHLVVEEKLDGANAGIGFGPGGELLLQSRGHYLTGGPRERQFAPFKAWAATLAPRLHERLGDRYVLYGEWMYAKHTVYYDALPHLFCEFDILDTRDGAFLDTPARREMLAGLPVASVPVLHTGPLERLADLTALVGPSTCRTPRWREALADAHERAREHLRAHRSFVWNATNVSRSLRDRCTGLAAAYGARVEITAVEAPPRVLCTRLDRRPAPVPAAVIDRLVGRWEHPDPTEAHRLTLVGTGP
ncbi:RNA ligase family protein [Nocardiopsis sp. CC223A]|uniref:RNA ligase family protein n=1 Tax=Nocardiopsis sp. CC223A TaxID=3044051 RepID=UPI00278C8BAE|nr:RNA ligase family protein [Nocardiopsis sp. CC223A]